MAKVLAEIEHGHDVGMCDLSGHSRLLVHPQVANRSQAHGHTTADVLFNARVYLSQGAASDGLGNDIAPDARRMAVIGARQGLGGKV
jgi:hypothetical protein